MTSRGYTIASIVALTLIAAGSYAHAQLSVHQPVTAQYCTRIAMPDITARAAYVYDVQNDTRIFGKNTEAQLPLASLTKLATAVVASAELKDTRTVTISEQALTPEGDSGFFAGETWAVQDLLDFTLMTSSNDGARALALAAAGGSTTPFIEAMNAFATEIGATQTFFVNETGLDISSSTAGAYGSARDVAHLLAQAYAVRGDAFLASTQSASAFTSLSGFTHEATHTADIAGTLPGELIVKTGFTDLAGGNLAVLTEVLPGRPVAVVVLGATRETRESDVATLIEAARAQMKRATLCNKFLVSYDY